MASPTSGSPTPSATENSGHALSAVVKGAGPSGLAAAIALAQSGFNVHVVDKRPRRPIGLGRKNMVALRPEALRQLDVLGALKYALSAENKNGNLGCLTRMTEGRTTNEIDGSVFEWPLKRYPGAEPIELISDGSRYNYEIPSKISEQVPSSFINLGDLEDCLAQAAEDLGVQISYTATVHLSRDGISNIFSANLESNTGSTTNLGTPTLIVCASGKNDPSVTDELKVDRLSRAVLSDANLSVPADLTKPFILNLQDTTSEPLESQLYSVFGIKYPTLPIGTLNHVIRAYISDANLSQPITEIQMNHATAAHFILQHPRSDPPLHADTQALETYILGRINDRLGTDYLSVSQLSESGNIVWGEPLVPITVETVTARQFVYGENVVLVGDCAMSCSPSSGLGADIGMTVDSQSVRVLAEALKDARTCGEHAQERRREALVRFNRMKAESAVVWSQGSRMFYLTAGEAEGILDRQRGGI